MGENQDGGSKPFDPLESFRGLRDIYIDAMAKTMVEAVNTEDYAKASGAMLDTTLTMSAPMREAMEKSMLQVLQQLSLPSRQDIVILAERFTNMEMRLDDLDAKLDRVLALASAKPEFHLDDVYARLDRIQNVVLEAVRNAARNAAHDGLPNSPPPAQPAVAGEVAAPNRASRPKKPASAGKAAGKGAK